MKAPEISLEQEEWVCRLAAGFGCEFVLCAPAAKPHSMVPFIVSASHVRELFLRLERTYGKDAVVVIEMEEMVAQ